MQEKGKKLVYSFKEKFCSERFFTGEIVDECGPIKIVCLPQEHLRLYFRSRARLGIFYCKKGSETKFLQLAEDAFFAKDSTSRKPVIITRGYYMLGVLCHYQARLEQRYEYVAAKKEMGFISSKEIK